MKKVILTALVAVSLTTQAQEKKASWFNNVKLSGYGMTQYQYSSRENDKSNTFNLRMFRLALDGRIMDEFYWKAQVQLSGWAAVPALSICLQNGNDIRLLE